MVAVLSEGPASLVGPRVSVALLAFHRPGRAADRQHDAGQEQSELAAQLQTG